MKNQDLNRVESLIQIQLEYLNKLKNSDLKSFYSNPDRAGFYRISLEINKQINKIKNK